MKRLGAPEFLDLRAQRPNPRGGRDTVTRAATTLIIEYINYRLVFASPQLL
jgi:hypothetical protein